MLPYHDSSNSIKLGLLPAFVLYSSFFAGIIIISTHNSATTAAFRINFSPSLEYHKQPQQLKSLPDYHVDSCPLPVPVPFQSHPSPHPVASQPFPNPFPASCPGFLRPRLAVKRNSKPAQCLMCPLPPFPASPPFQTLSRHKNFGLSPL